MASNKVFGYARVSAKDQNLDRQIQELQAAGISERDIFTDKASGKDFARPQYQTLKNVLRESDVLIIKSIDRLGRNYNDILTEWRTITKEIKAHIKVLDLPLLDTTTDTQDLTGAFISDIVLQILSYVAEQERASIKQRQAEGIAAARKSGKELGRPKAQKPENWDKVIKQWQDGEITATAAMEQMNMKRNTFYRLLKV